jgi:vacuolar protein sorting-associated protein 35
LIELLKFIHQTIFSLGEVREYFVENDLNESQGSRSHIQKPMHNLLPAPEMALRLFLLGAQLSDESNEEELAYEFVVQALTVYEEAISESKAQYACMSLIIGRLCNMSVFGYENYEILIMKCAVHCSRLLKRADQARGLLLASHLFWGNDDIRRSEDKPVYRDSKKVIELLQRSTKIAESVMDKSVSIELLLGILDRYIWHYEAENDQISPRLINSMIQTISTSLKGMQIASPQVEAEVPSPSIFDKKLLSNRLPAITFEHFQNIIRYISRKKQKESASLDATVSGVLNSGFGGDAHGRWGDFITNF